MRSSGKGVAFAAAAFGVIALGAIALFLRPQNPDTEGPTARTESADGAQRASNRTCGPNVEGSRASRDDGSEEAPGTRESRDGDPGDSTRPPDPDPTGEGRPQPVPQIPGDSPLRLSLSGWVADSEQTLTGEALEFPVPGFGIADFAGLGRRSATEDEDVVRESGLRRGDFDPGNPDGMLEVWVTPLGFDEQTAVWGDIDKSLQFDAVLVRTRDRASWKIVKTQTDISEVCFVVPVAEGDTFQVQIQGRDGSSALAYLPVPGTLHRNAGDVPRQDLYRAGLVKLDVRMVPSNPPKLAREMRVQGADGGPVSGAVVLQGGQEFGRSDVQGAIRWPLPPMSPPPPKSSWGYTHRTVDGKVVSEPKTEPPPPPSWERGFLVYVTGFVPVVIPREDVSVPHSPPLTITLNAREFLASVHTEIVDKRFLYRLGDSKIDGGSRPGSEILQQTWDLLPLEPTVGVSAWQDAFYYLTQNHRDRESWIADITKHEASDPFSRNRMKTRADPWMPGQGRASSWAEGLEQATGRPWLALWPDFYGGWYNGRWKYDGGRFDVVLPYPGKFLLLAGEEYREGMPRSAPGRLNHVLTIDARDLNNVTGQMLRSGD